MKVIIAGAWYADIYEKAFSDAFEQLGHEVYKFNTSIFFKNYIGDGRLRKSGTKTEELWYKFQYKYIIGPAIKKINQAFIEFVQNTSVDLIFIYRGVFFYPSTLEKVKKITNAKLFAYNNDDPFSLQHPKYLWRHYLKGLKYYDHIFAYRQKNLLDYKEQGILNTSLLRAYYLKNQNYPTAVIDSNKYICDVSFIGHYENDGRDEYLKYLIDNKIDVKIFGTCWESSKYYSFFTSALNSPIYPVYKDYNLCIASAKICLVFLSKLNNDTYTRRCFEIPAAKAFMLAEYTDDLNSMYTEGLEAEYFRDKEELLKKVIFYLKNPDKIGNVRSAGYERILNDGHEAIDRVFRIMEIYTLSSSHRY